MLEFERIEREIHEGGEDQRQPQQVSPRTEKMHTELAARIGAARESGISVKHILKIKFCIFFISYFFIADSFTGSQSSLTEFEQLERDVLREQQAADEAAAAVMMLTDIREESDEDVVEERTALPDARQQLGLVHIAAEDERMSTGADEEEEAENVRIFKFWLYV